MKIYGLLLLILPIVSLQASAQNEAGALDVGDKAPALTVYKWIKGKPTTNFRDDKIYLVEFGATWCHPCADAIPHLTAIANKFKNKLTVISIFVMEPRKNAQDISYVQNVTRYVSRFADHINYNIGTDDPNGTIEKSWLKAANLSGVPHAFVIDRNGKIAWIGNPDEGVLEQVVELVNGDSYNINDAIAANKRKQSQSRPFVDPRKPLFIDNNGGSGKDFLFRSVVTKYNGEMGGNWDYVHTRDWAKLDVQENLYEGMVQQIGSSIGNLYYMAYGDTVSNQIFTRRPEFDWKYPDTLKYPTMNSHYGKYWYRAILEVKDTTAFEFDYRSYNNRYNYSLVVPDEKATAKFLQQCMQSDLKNYFGYDAVVEERLMPYWKLIAFAPAVKLLKAKDPNKKYKYTKSADSMLLTNGVMKDLLIQFIQLPFSFGHSSYGIRPIEEAPFIDETIITEDIDFSVSLNEWDQIRQEHNWQTLLNVLHRYELDLVKGERMTKVVVIRDPKTKP